MPPRAPSASPASVLMLMLPRSPGPGLKESSSWSVTEAAGGGRLLAATLLLSSSVSTQEVFIPAALHFYKNRNVGLLILFILLIVIRSYNNKEFIEGFGGLGAVLSPSGFANYIL